VLSGHSPWEHPLASLDGGGQLLNVAERAVLLLPANAASTASTA
jgi:hypothetical protein